MLYPVLYFFSNFLLSQVVINEYSVSNLADYEDNYESFEDWIELYNTSSIAVDISGYHLSDKLSNPTKWLIPAGTTISANGFKVFWASGRDVASGGHYHTNFKFSQTKVNTESVIFADESGEIIDSRELELTKLSHARGRIADGSETWGVFINSTLGSSNNSTISYEGYTARPSMDIVAGFYSSGVTVNVTSTEPNSTLHYTLDGSEPMPVSPVYLGPIAIDNTAILKAKAISNNPNILDGLIEYNTYFINETHTTRVISTASEELPLLIGW